MVKFQGTIFLTLLVIVVWNGIGWPYEVRFNYLPLNYFVYAAVIVFLPISAIGAGLTLQLRYVKIVTIICCVIILIPSLLVGAIVFVDGLNMVKTNTDLSHEFLKETSTDNGVYRLYRTNCGATCAFGLELQKEIDTPLGIKFVKPVWSKLRAYDADLTSSGQTIKIDGNVIVTAR